MTALGGIYIPIIYYIHVGTCTLFAHLDRKGKAKLDSELQLLVVDLISHYLSNHKVNIQSNMVVV